jgi:thymidine phosphorylase
MLLGAGRTTAEGKVDPAAGIILHRKVGDFVRTGDALASLHYNPSYGHALPAALEMFKQAVTLADEPVPRPPLILERL